MLFVANADTNNVAVVQRRGAAATRKPLGFIPAGWYPTSVRVTRDGKTLYVANGKGADLEGQPRRARTRWHGRPTDVREYIAGLFQGTLSHRSRCPTPEADGRLLEDASTSAARCGRTPADRRRPDGRAGNPIPAKVGDPSPIKHCIYIIKENRTYDQVFGDMPEGNGDPSLCLFPEEVTPNHHALAREFVLLDNFYVEGEVSRRRPRVDDGGLRHRLRREDLAAELPRRPRASSPYPGRGRLRPIARPAGGYLWDRAAEAGVSYRSYGEFIDNGKTPDDPRHDQGQGARRATSTRSSAATTSTTPT